LNPQDPLAQLRPLREPAIIDWWPPAPGWWLLAIVALLTVTAIVYFLRRYWRRNAYRRQALKQLATLQQQHASLENDTQYATELNALLKSTALAAYPSKDVAAKHGEQWRQFLNQELPSAEQFQAAFFDAAYASESPSLDRAQLQRCAERWIKKHRVTQ
jgi:transposase